MTKHQHTGRILTVRTGRILECADCGELAPLYCALCDDPAHTAGVMDGHIFSSWAEQQRRIIAARAANDRFAAAELRAAQDRTMRENVETTRRMMRGEF